MKVYHGDEDLETKKYYAKGVTPETYIRSKIKLAMLKGRE